MQKPVDWLETRLELAFTESNFISHYYFMAAGEGTEEKVGRLRKYFDV